MHVPRKRFGQHFLHDRHIIQRIVDAIDPRKGDPLVEIGPGLGAITQPLLERVDRLEAIEIDRDAIAHLQSQFGKPEAGRGELHIHEADVLDFKLEAIAQGRRLRLVGNLPYNISTPLLFALIEQRQHIADMHFMLQKEVVDRMAAKAGDDDYGRLSVMLAPWLNVESLFDIGPGAFRPPPKVVSSFARLTPHASPPFQIADQKRFAALVSAAFSQRRKTLRNSLRALVTAEQITAAGIDPGHRAEVISPEQFAALALENDSGR